MGSESLQHKLDRVRRPRVQITYDVETGGAMQKVELPFVVGVMADLSGQPKEPLKPLKDRKVVTIDRDNFNDVLAKPTPRVAMKVRQQADRRGHQAGRRAELQAHGRLRARQGRRADRPAQRAARDARTPHASS